MAIWCTAEITVDTTYNYDSIRRSIVNFFLFANYYLKESLRLNQKFLNY